MDKYVDIKVKNFAKYNKKIYFFVAKEKTIPNDPNLLDQVVLKYRDVLKENPGVITFIDFRMVENFPVSLLWTKANTYAAELDPIARKSLYCSCVFVSRPTVKTFINSILQVYPPVRPLKVCNTNEEGMRFAEEIIKKISKK
jgi:hypothetical protein